ncbi:hypothetical protein [Glutamicibacter sp.]|uniref:hypothetical protein n=1 Tax=Glutamicibacter sp. TaxID=1931995 RepID=UPI003D6A29C0
MDGILWWEIETADQDQFQQFHAALRDWSFEPAFADTELGADYRIIQSEDRSTGGLQQAISAAALPSPGPRGYVAVHDLEDALERVVELGGMIERTRTALGGDDRWFGAFRVLPASRLAYGHSIRGGSSFSGQRLGVA